MKITIKNIIKENKDIDPKQRFVNEISKIIKPPYFYFLRVNEVPEKLWNEILSKLFNQKVKYENRYPYPFRIFDSNNNEIYIEESYEDDNDEIEHIELGLPVEASWYGSWYGFWSKREYDENNNRIYQVDSTGFWSKREYDSNNNIIYYEDSDGVIRDNRPSNSLNENIDPKEKYINGIINILKPPYFNFLRVNEVPKYLWYRILSKVFNQELEVSGDIIYNSNGNVIYLENSNGYWYKQEYDSNNNEIYYEDSDGVIIYRRPSNTINENIDPKERYVNKLSSILKPPYFYNLIITETPINLWTRILSKVFNQEVNIFNNKIYDSNNNLIYYENSNGDWEKHEYDSNGNIIYYENSNGYWRKQEYDSNNNLIYSENSNGEIYDRRSSNTINENIDPKQRYVNGIVNMIRRPYMEFLINNEVPEELWKDILSKTFNTNVIFWEIELGDDEVYYELTIRNEKDKLLYFETQDYWEQQIYGYHNRLDMDFTWYVNSVGSKKVTFIGKHNPIVYSNGPTGYSWSGLSDDIKNNKFFDLNY